MSKEKTTLDMQKEKHLQKIAAIQAQLRRLQAKKNALTRKEHTKKLILLGKEVEKHFGQNTTPEKLACFFSYIPENFKQALNNLELNDVQEFFAGIKKQSKGLDSPQEKLQSHSHEAEPAMPAPKKAKGRKSNKDNNTLLMTF